MELLIHEYRPDLFICTESRVTQDVLESEIKIGQYKLLRSDSNSRSSGGVTVYVRDCMKAQVIVNDVNNYDHILVFHVYDGLCRGRWLAVYHSPNAPHNEFLDRLEEVHEQHTVPGQPTYTNGDFNINMRDNNYNTYKQRLIRFQSMTSMKQIVNKYTRVTKNSKTMIDLFFTNVQTVKVEVSENDIIADHKVLLIKKDQLRRNYEKMTIRDRSKCTEPNVKQNLVKNFNHELFNQTDINEKAVLLYETLDKSVNDLISEKQVTLFYSKRWFDVALRELRSEHR